MLPLFERFPALGALPYYPIGSFPTPVVSSPELARKAGVNEVWIKRDDLTAERYGGNKVRKLEFLLGDARDKGVKGVWTVGAIGSNHVVATAVYAREAGLEVHIHHFGQPVTGAVRRNCLIAASRATSLRLGNRNLLPLALVGRALRGRFEKPPNVIYTVPAGGSTPLGELGYANAALELAGQIDSGELPKPDTIVVPVGTGGTLAGLVTGLALIGLEIPVVGVRVVDRIIVNRIWVGRLIRKAVRLLGRYGVDARRALRKAAYRLDHSQFGRAYGEPTAAAKEAVDVFSQAVGLDLETTYTGKAMAGLLASGRKWVAGTGRLLFIDTFNSRPLEPLLPSDFGWDDLPAGYRQFAPKETA